MKIIEKIKFISLEFDFKAEGNLDAEVFIEIKNDGISQNLIHKLQLQDVGFNDFLTPEAIEENTNVGDNFSTFIQSFRNLITLKVANDLGLDFADVEYKTNTPIMDIVKTLESSQSEQDKLIMKLLLGGKI